MTHVPLRHRLVKVTAAGEFHNPNEPPLALGSVVRLNSGGPAMVVVDIDGAGVTAAWRDAAGAAQEVILLRACVHRVRHGEGQGP